MAVGAVEAAAEAALPVAAVEAAAVSAAVVVGSPGVVLLLPEASLAAGRVAAVSEARQGLEAVGRVAPPERAASVR